MKELLIAKVFNYNGVYSQGGSSVKKRRIITFLAKPPTYKLNKPPHSSKPLPN